MKLHAHHGRALAASLFIAQISMPVLADSDIEALRQELQALKAQYESHIESLEQRLDAAEARLSEVAQENEDTVVSFENYPVATNDAISDSYAGASNAYNPAIGVIVNGQFTAYDENPDKYEIPGFPAGGESGLADEGLSIGESEFVFTSNVDDWFYGQITASVEQEDGEFDISLEEAFLDTLAMPFSTTLRFGRFFSGVGYLNDKHSHTWDFTDQALPYAAMLGGQYGDDGIQFRWLAPTDMFLELGAEVFSGSEYPAAGRANDGLGSRSLFAHAGGDVGFSHSWSAGLSWLHAKAEDRSAGADGDAVNFDGDSDIYIADVLWKWAPNGNVRERNLKFQAEYLWRTEDGKYRLPGVENPSDINADSSGWYAQAIYQWQPRWRAGIRIDGLDQDNPGSRFTGTALEPAADNPMRYSFMLDYSNSEFSRLRLQYNRDESGLKNDNQLMLQYIMSIGAHGAHEF